MVKNITLALQSLTADLQADLGIGTNFSDVRVLYVLSSMNKVSKQTKHSGMYSTPSKALGTKRNEFLC